MAPFRSTYDFPFAQGDCQRSEQSEEEASMCVGPEGYADAHTHTLIHIRTHVDTRSHTHLRMQAKETKAAKEKETKARGGLQASSCTESNRSVEPDPNAQYCNACGSCRPGLGKVVCPTCGDLN